MMEGLSVADAIALQDKGNDGMMGGNGMWIFFLFFLLAYGNGGGMFGGGAEAGQITNDFMFQGINSKLDAGFTQTANQNFAIQRDILQGFNGVDNAVCSLGYNTQQGFSAIGAQLANCCCETNRNIDAVRYENAKNTCEIVTNANMNTRDILAGQVASTQRIVDIMNQQEIQSLRDNLQTANMQLSQQALVQQLRPAPIPSYLTCSPFVASNPCGC